MKKLLLGGLLVATATGTFYLEQVEYVLPLHYPTNINLRAYWWDLQESSNLITWTTVQSNLGPADARVTMTNNARFYRMIGR